MSFKLFLWKCNNLNIPSDSVVICTKDEVWHARGRLNHIKLRHICSAVSYFSLYWDAPTYMDNSRTHWPYQRLNVQLLDTCASRDGDQTITSTPVGSTHNPSTAGQNSALPPDTTDGVQNTTSVGSAHNANPVGDAHSHTVSKANRASQTEMQRGNNSVAKPYADATARRGGAKSPQKPQTQGKKSLKESVEITPSYIPTRHRPHGPRCFLTGRGL